MRNLSQPLLIAFLLALTLPLLAAVAEATTAPTPSPTQDLDVPFVVSAPVVTRTMLEMAKVTRDDYVIDLGSGDGRIVFLAARQYGARGLGVEIDPRLVETAREDAQKLKLAHLVTFRKQDLFTTDLGAATVITMYLLPDVNLALRPKLLGLKPGTRIVSHDWDMGDWTPDEDRTIDNPEKSLGLEKKSRVYLWVVPAKLGGKWCAQQSKSTTNAAINVELRLDQQYQKLDGVLTANMATKSRGLEVRFRATLNGDRFVIPHSGQNTDAPAAADGESILLNGQSYGLASNLIFRRATSPSAVCGADHTINAASR